MPRERPNALGRKRIDRLMDELRGKQRRHPAGREVEVVELPEESSRGS
jgi:hypothetical protein